MVSIVLPEEDIAVVPLVDWRSSVVGNSDNSVNNNKKQILQLYRSLLKTEPHVLVS